MSVSTKALSLLVGVLVMLSLFSLVVTVHVAADLSPGTWKNTTVDNGGNVGVSTSSPSSRNSLKTTSSTL